MRVHDQFKEKAAVLIFYTTVLDFAQEVQYIWSTRFSLPTLLYAFTRYGRLISQGLNVGVNFVPVRWCSDSADANHSIILRSWEGTIDSTISESKRLKESKIL